MEATAPRVPWWYIALFALAMTACNGLLNACGFGWSVQFAAVMLGLLCLIAAIHRLRK